MIKGAIFLHEQDDMLDFSKGTALRGFFRQRPPHVRGHECRSRC
jgi:hypothetical protein